MADPPHDPDTDGDVTTGPPRWVKVFGVIALLVVLVFVVLLFTGRGGEHGPGRHTLATGVTHGELLRWP